MTEVTTQFPDETNDDVTIVEVPVATTEETHEDVVTKPQSTLDDTTTQPSDTTTQPSDTTTVDNSVEDASNAECKNLIKEFEAKQDHLKKFYKNGNATKVLI